MVRIDSATDPRDFNAYTDEEGWAEFRELSRGPWEVRTETPEFEGMSQRERRTEAAQREGMWAVRDVEAANGCMSRGGTPVPRILQQEAQLRAILRSIG